MSALQIILAMIVTILWVASLIIRTWKPNAHADFGVLDSVVMLVFGFIYSISAVRRNGGNGNGKNCTTDKDTAE